MSDGESFALASAGIPRITEARTPPLRAAVTTFNAPRRLPRAEAPRVAPWQVDLELDALYHEAAIDEEVLNSSPEWEARSVEPTYASRSESGTTNSAGAATIVATETSERYKSRTTPNDADNVDTLHGYVEAFAGERAGAVTERGALSADEHLDPPPHQAVYARDERLSNHVLTDLQTTPATADRRDLREAAQATDQTSARALRTGDSADTTRPASLPRIEHERVVLREQVARDHTLIHELITTLAPIGMIDEMPAWTSHEISPDSMEAPRERTVRTAMGSGDPRPGVHRTPHDALETRLDTAAATVARAKAERRAGIRIDSIRVTMIAPPAQPAPAVAEQRPAGQVAPAPRAFADPWSAARRVAF